MNSIGAFALTS